ncbi:MAG: hypothetical protein AB1513_10010 [Pseudomonadota bacterium]
MYRSKEQVEKKLAQAKYALNQIQRYRGKIFVNNGIDPATGAHPLQVNVSSFLALTRSVLQYAYKECKERGELSAYETAVGRNTIIGVFRDLRDTDIHEMVVGVHTVVSLKSRLFKTEDETRKHPDDNLVEPNIKNHISKPVTVTAELIEQLRNDGLADLAGAATSGKSLYQTVEYNGEQDLHVLCENYIDSLSCFVDELSQKGVIS